MNDSITAIQTTYHSPSPVQTDFLSGTHTSMFPSGLFISADGLGPSGLDLVPRTHRETAGQDLDSAGLRKVFPEAVDSCYA